MEATIAGIEAPASVHVDPPGQYLYVGSFDYYNPAIHVIDTQSATIIATVPLDDSIQTTHLSTAESVLYVATTAPELVRIQADGVDVIAPHRHSDGFESGDCTGWTERQPPA